MSSTSERTLHDGRRYGRDPGGIQFGTFRPFQLQYDFEQDGLYGIPTLKPYSGPPPEEMEAFIKRRWKPQNGVHFYLNDANFEVVWNSPNRYLDLFKTARVILSPDFSTYTDWPVAAQIWNVFRNRWCGCFWQMNGIEVVPTISWGSEESYLYAFDGVVAGSTVSVSSVGSCRQKADREAFEAGFHEMVARLSPKEVWWFGKHWSTFDPNEIVPTRFYDYDWDHLGDSYGGS